MTTHGNGCALKIRPSCQEGIKSTNGARVHARTATIWCIGSRTVTRLQGSAKAKAKSHSMTEESDVVGLDSGSNSYPVSTVDDFHTSDAINNTCCFDATIIRLPAQSQGLDDSCASPEYEPPLTYLLNAKSRNTRSRTTVEPCATAQRNHRPDQWDRAFALRSVSTGSATRHGSTPVGPGKETGARAERWGSLSLGTVSGSSVSAAAAAAAAAAALQSFTGHSQLPRLRWRSGASDRSRKLASTTLHYTSSLAELAAVLLWILYSHVTYSAAAAAAGVPARLESRRAAAAAARVELDFDADVVLISVEYGAVVVGDGDGWVHERGGEGGEGRDSPTGSEAGPETESGRGVVEGRGGPGPRACAGAAAVGAVADADAGSGCPTDALADVFSGGFCGLLFRGPRTAAQLPTASGSFLLPFTSALLLRTSSSCSTPPLASDDLPAAALVPRLMILLSGCVDDRLGPLWKSSYFALPLPSYGHGGSFSAAVAAFPGRVHLPIAVGLIRFVIASCLRSLHESRIPLPLRGVLIGRSSSAEPISAQSCSAQLSSVCSAAAGQISSQEVIPFDCEAISFGYSITSCSSSTELFGRCAKKRFGSRNSDEFLIIMTV
ncbi:hypothetical protein MARPO_0014s0144 [Marchantia polymorpha]|uniref:Uncharacterized protein n=1 Tax=Marchantia polymorpha TaxID=3197 RepID=A0A2R6XHP2_MARPO|nr:hypothetical protein MARPO_0014s0144 [Marchantia polymorpha]|eukprot:PTQ45625.1 hypothetical protein MARPO_0014s0144 [Marchantia polymorpha]